MKLLTLILHSSAFGYANAAQFDAPVLYDEGEQCFFKDCKEGLECIKTRKYKIFNQWICHKPIVSGLNERCYFKNNAMSISTCKEGLECKKIRRYKFHSVYKCLYKNQFGGVVSPLGGKCDLSGTKPELGNCAAGLQCVETPDLKLKDRGVCQDLRMNIIYSVHSPAPVNIATRKNFHYFKLYLQDIDVYFNEKIHWNTEYRPAKEIYSNNLKGFTARKILRTNHALIYSNRYGRYATTKGTISKTADGFLQLLNQYRDSRILNLPSNENGVEYYTYTLMPESLRFSRTGKELAVDFSSKHALHAGGSPWVLAAGEFWIKDNILYIDNASGTFSPPVHSLVNLQRLLENSFDGLAIVTLKWDSSEWKYLRSN
jgi:hypothetical protein